MVGEAVDSSWGVIQLSFVGVVTAVAVAAGATLAAWWWFGLGASMWKALAARPGGLTLDPTRGPVAADPTTAEPFTTSPRKGKNMN